MKKVAHDIRNPVAVIQGYLQYRQKFPLSQEEQEYWQAAQKCTERLLDIADNLSPSQVQSKPKQIVLSQENKNILVVDDDQEIQIQWKSLFQSKNMGYLGVDRGESLLTMKIDYSQYDAAIVDYEFENSSLNGFDVIEFLKRKRVETLYLCTGLAENPEIKDLARKHQVTSIIAKPLPEDVFDILLKDTREK